jgi:hypothetical protein
LDINDTLSVGDPCGIFMNVSNVVGFCKDCFWWGELIEQSWWTDSDKRCPGICDMTIRYDNETLKHEYTKAKSDYAWDGDACGEFENRLRTSPDFGCVQWKKKEDENE